jgi:hypothetical protein
MPTPERQTYSVSVVFKVSALSAEHASQIIYRSFGPTARTARMGMVVMEVVRAGEKTTRL